MIPLTSSLIYLTVIAITAMADSLFDTNYVEQNTMRMIKTGEENYAIQNPHFGDGWQCISVNGDQATVVKNNAAKVVPLSSLSPNEKSQLANAKGQLNSIIINGPYGCGNPCKLTTFTRHGGTSSAGSGSGGSSSVSSYSTGTLSLSVYNDDEFIATKVNFPFNWQRLFYRKDVVGIVYNNGQVTFRPTNALNVDEKKEVDEIKAEVKRQRKSSNDLMSSIGNPFDFVRKSLGSFGPFG